MKKSFSGKKLGGQWHCSAAGGLSPHTNAGKRGNVRDNNCLVITAPANGLSQRSTVVRGRTAL